MAIANIARREYSIRNLCLCWRGKIGAKDKQQIPKHGFRAEINKEIKFCGQGLFNWAMIWNRKKQ